MYSAGSFDGIQRDIVFIFMENVLFSVIIFLLSNGKGTGFVYSSSGLMKVCFNHVRIKLRIYYRPAEGISDIQSTDSNQYCFEINRSPGMEDFVKNTRFICIA